MILRFYSLTILSLSFTVIGCGDATNAPTVGVADFSVPAVFNASGAPTVEFSVPDMMCPEGCAVEVKEILAEQPGAKDVRVDFEAKTATVAFAEGDFDADLALAALVDKQFTNTSLKESAAATVPAENASAVQ